MFIWIQSGSYELLITQRSFICNWDNPRFWQLMGHSWFSDRSRNQIAFRTLTSVSSLCVLLLHTYLKALIKQNALTSSFENAYSIASIHSTKKVVVSFRRLMYNHRFHLLLYFHYEPQISNQGVEKDVRHFYLLYFFIFHSLFSWLLFLKVMI